MKYKREKKFINKPENKFLIRNKKNKIFNGLKKANKIQRKQKSKYPWKKFNIFIISIIIALSAFYLIKNGKININLIFSYKRGISDIYFDEKFPLLNESFINAKNFLDQCLKGNIINNQTFKASENPKISAILTLHNCQKTVSRAIKSIQNQDITDIEIILVNDFSNDNTFSIIEEVAKTDPRIRIINNQKNMGTYYCRSIGVLSSKGKHIFHLDCDDMILDRDVFSTVTYIANKGDFDIINFRAVFALHSPNLLNAWVMENYFSNHTSGLILKQPEMGLYPFRPGKVYGKYDITDSYIWLKCVKTSVYQKVVNKVGEERYTRYQSLEEDRTDIYALHQTGESMKYIGKYGYLKIQTPASMTWRNHEKKETVITKLYFNDISIDFSKDTLESKKVLVYFITNLMETEEFEEVMKEKEYYKKLFMSCIERLLKSKYIENEDKEEIKRRVSKYDILKS